MSLESDLSTLLKTVCPRTFPDVAPSGTAAPFIAWQALGGESLRYLDNTAPDKRNTYMQVSVYSKTRAEALALKPAACRSSTNCCTRALTTPFCSAGSPKIKP